MPFSLPLAVAFNAGYESLRHFKSLGLKADASPEAVAEAVHDFQLAHLLDADGMAGPVTLRALFVADGCSPAPVLPFVMPVTIADVEKLYGHRVVLHPDPNNAARLKPGKDLEAHLRVFTFPVAGGTDRVTLHKVTGQAILDAYTWACAVADHLPVNVDGTVCRRKNWDPKGNPSQHSIGAAIDCDTASNGRGDQTPSLPQRFFSAMRACGVICGRNFGQPKKPKETDPMHFQVTKDSAVNAVPIVPR